MNCNEEFKRNFKLGYDKNSKNTISSLFPSNSQKQRHFELM